MVLRGGGGDPGRLAAGGDKLTYRFAKFSQKISRNSIFGASGAAIGRSATGSGLSRFTIITACNSSCGKVMFSQVCVKNSVHRWGRMYLPSGCLPDGRMSAWGRGCLPRVFCLGGGQTRPKYCGIRSTIGRYASYWNAFLFKIMSQKCSLNWLKSGDIFHFDGKQKCFPFLSHKFHTVCVSGI